jgi:hypothetical protein
VYSLYRKWFLYARSSLFLPINQEEIAAPAVNGSLAPAGLGSGRVP